MFSGDHGVHRVLELDGIGKISIGPLRQVGGEVGELTSLCVLLNDVINVALFQKLLFRASGRGEDLAGFVVDQLAAVLDALVGTMERTLDFFAILPPHVD